MEVCEVGATRSAKSNFDQLMISGMRKEGKPRLRARARRKIRGVPAKKGKR